MAVGKDGKFHHYLSSKMVLASLITYKLLSVPDFSFVFEHAVICILLFIHNFNYYKNLNLQILIV